MQVWSDWQVTLCDPHLSALEVRFSRRCAIQIDVYLYLTVRGIFWLTHNRVVTVLIINNADLCENADDKLSNAITSDCKHVLHYLLPPQSKGSQHYDLRQRPHNFALPSRTGHLTDKNYIQRILYLNSYSCLTLHSLIYLFIVLISTSTFHCTRCVLSAF